MEQAVINSINGKVCTDSKGRQLIRIGNLNIQPSDVVWTDRKYIYGMVSGSNDEPETSVDGGLDGIPFTNSLNFFTVDKKDGKVNNIWNLKKDVIEFFGMVNDQNNMYVCIGERDSNGVGARWYQVGRNTWQDVCEGHNTPSYSDAQVSKTGRLLTLNSNGLYTNGALTNPRASDSTVWARCANLAVAKATTLNASSIHSPANFGGGYRHGYLRDWFGRIYDDDSYYLLSPDLQGQSNFAFDYTWQPPGGDSEDAQTVCYAIGLNLWCQAIYNKGSLTYQNDEYQGNIGGYNNNGGGCIKSARFKGVTDKYTRIPFLQGAYYLTHYYNPYINEHQKDEGYILVPAIGVGGTELGTTLFIPNHVSDEEDSYSSLETLAYAMYERNGSVDALDVCEEDEGWAFNYWSTVSTKAPAEYSEGDKIWSRETWKPNGDYLFWYEKNETDNWIHRFPLNGNYRVEYTKLIDPNGTVLLEGEFPRRTYVYQLDKKKGSSSIQLVIGGELVRIDPVKGETQYIVPTNNYRISPINNLQSHIATLKRLVASLGDELKSGRSS